MDNTLIISIHGLRTKEEDPTEWQPEFDHWLRKNENYANQVGNHTLVHLPFSYGVVSIPTFLTIGLLMKLHLDKLASSYAVSKFSKFLREAIAAYPGYNVHIMAHSFGTWITQETLKANDDLKVKTVNFYGGIVSSHIRDNYLDELLMLKQVENFVVWCSHNDGVVRFAPPPYGHIGFWGAITEDPVDRNQPKWQPFEYLNLYNRFTTFGHCDYFVPDTFKTTMSDILNGPKQ